MPAPRRQPPRLRVVEDAEAERRATWLELFFDLVFVVAIAELAGVLHDRPDWDGFARFVPLSVPVIWVWMNFIFYADQFDTDDVPYRLAVFAGMLASAALAVSLPAAASGFVLAYVAIKAIMVELYERARRHADTRLARRFCGWGVGARGAPCRCASPPPVLRLVRGRVREQRRAVAALARLRRPVPADALGARPG